MDRVRILRQSPIFSTLNDDELTELAGLTVERIYRSGEFVFWEGDVPDWFFIVAEGKVKVLKHSSLGKDFIIAFFGAGEMFGEVAVLASKPYPASAQAATEAIVLGIRRQDLLSFLAQRPEVALRIINVLGERLRDARNSLPLALQSIFDDFIADYKYAATLRYGRPYISYHVLADMIRAGWRPSAEPIK